MTAKNTEDKTVYLVNGVTLEDTTVIEFAANPKRANSAAWARYEKYQAAKTWGEFRALNKNKHMMADARHDMSKNFLKLTEE